MASDVENLTTFYANLPSIFESNPSTSIEPLSNTSITITDNEKTYQPIFGSFLFADSEPFMRAAFVASTSSSIEIKSTEEEQTDEASDLKENNIKAIGSSPLAPVEDISDMDNNDDEDDFDGIPIRHASTMIKEKFNNDNYSEHNNLLERIVHSGENNNNDDDDVEELFLNGFTDEQHQHDKTTIPSLFNNIPDIDDLNEHEEENDDDDRIPFDHMDMLDQSDSIRSSSPDSVLSSSHLRDDDDDDDMNNNDDEDDVTQWNDDYLLGKINLQNDRPNAPLPPPIVLNIHPHDQVDFIDLSRSNSRCSNASSHLSMGYTDQAQIFINDDDGLVASFDSESDLNDDDQIDFKNDLLSRDNSEEPRLQVNLDYHRSRSLSRSSYSPSNSPHSSLSSPIPDQSPIVAIDEDINDIKNDIQSAPIAIVDDDNDDDDDLQAFISDRPVLSPIPLKNFIEFQNENRQNEIIQDIVKLRHMINDHDNDDEFIAIMHNPTVFEEVLYDNDDQQKSDLIKQTNIVTTIFQPSSQLSIDNKMKSESSEYYQNIQEESLLSISNNEKNRPSNITTTNNSSTTAVNHLPLEIDKEEQEEEENVDAINRSRIKLKKTQQSKDKNTTHINIEQITNCEQEQQDHYQMMSSDDESDNDSELLETLAQLHGLVHTPRLSSEINETDIFKNQIQQSNEEKTNYLISNFNNNEKQNLIFSNNNDKYQKQNDERNEEQNSSMFFSLPSLMSSILFNDDESHSIDTILDSDASSSVIILNKSILSSNQLIEKDNNQFQQELESSFDNEIISIVEKLVSNTLRLAIDEINETNRQILSEAIYQIYNEDENLSTDNLALIINWHNQIPKQSFDPFDQKFHNIWINHFQTPEDIINENNINSTLFHSDTFDQSNSSLLINPFTDNDLTKYPLTESVKEINTNDNSFFQDNTNETSITPDEQINNEPKVFSSIRNFDDVPLSPIIEINENNDSQLNKRNSYFENQQRLSQFEAFASEHPLNTTGLESITAEIDNQFDESSQIRKSTSGDDNEPWELEDNNEEKLKPIPTIITQKYDTNNNFFSDDNNISKLPPSTDESADEENNDEVENENYDKYFTNYQTNQNTENIEIPPSKTVRFSENLQNVAVLTPKDSINLSELSTTTSDSDETDDEHETSNLQTTNNHINEKETSDNDTNDVIMRNSIPRPESNISLTESEDLPPPLPPLPPLNKPTNANDNIPIKTSPSSNIDLKRKLNLRSQSENTPAISTTTDSRLYANKDSQLIRSNDSGIVKFIFIRVEYIYDVIPIHLILNLSFYYLLIKLKLLILVLLIISTNVSLVVIDDKFLSFNTILLTFSSISFSL